MITSAPARPPPLISVEDLETILGRLLSEEERGQAEVFLAAASDTIRRLTGQTLSYAETVEVHDGWSAPLLQLRELPVVEVFEIQMGSQLVDPNSYRIDYETGALWRGWGWSSIGAVMQAGRQGVFVFYGHGWQELPAELALVTANMASRALATPAAGDFQSESLGPYRYDRGDLAGLGGVGLSAAEATLIEKYRVRRQVIQ